MTTAHTTTNQKKASTTEGSMEVRCDEREACGKYDTIVVTKIEQQRKKKMKYTMALNSRRQINFHTTTNQK